jgi:2-oxoglutarate ferredoxin oxidoreductase subunit delta
METTLVRQPLEQFAIRIPRGQTYIIPSRCKGCRFCIDFCPKDILEESSDINSKGYHYPVVAGGMEEDCIHCEFCTFVCPEFAIYTEQLAEEDS